MEVELVNVVEMSGGVATCVCVRESRLVVGSGGGAAALLRWRGGCGWQLGAERVAAHRYGVTAAAFSPAGLLVATAGGDGVVRIWSSDDLSARRELTAPQASAVCAVAWGGGRVVAAHADGAVRVWRARGALLAAMRVHDDALRGLAMLADNALLLTAAADGVVKVYNFDDVCKSGAEGGSAASPLLWEDGAHDLGALCAAAAGRTAATGGHDACVRLWHVTGDPGSRRVEAGARLRGPGGPGGAVAALAAASGALAAGAADGTARVWALPGGVRLRDLRAHSRFLTCLALPHDARFLVTGSNDKTLRTWSLGHFSLESSLEPVCSPDEHFALGDLEGIAPLEDVDNEGDYVSCERDTERGGFTECDVCGDRTGCEGYGSAAACGPCGGRAGCGEAGGRPRCVWAERTHAAAINSIAVADKFVATCSSDGWVHVYSLDGGDARGEVLLRRCTSAHAHSYPALAADFDPSGIRLLCTGLDGRAVLLDAESGALLSCVCASAACYEEGCSSEAGGGGVRGARVAPVAPPRALLVTDDGLAALWPLDTEDNLIIVASGLCEGALCCAWSGDARAAALGAGSGELRLLAFAPATDAPATPATPTTLCRHTDAHDLGVLSCDFASDSQLITKEDSKTTHILATGGRDALIKIWRVTLVDTEQGVRGALAALRAVRAHTGGVHCVRWRGARLASAGADRCPRVWCLKRRADDYHLEAWCAAAVGGGGGAAAAALLAPALLAAGSLHGELSLWQLPEVEENDEEEECPRFWELLDVIRWLHDYVTRRPGGCVGAAEEAALERAARAARARGPALLDSTLCDALALFGLANDGVDGQSEVSASTRRRLRDELLWLRRPGDDLTQEVLPHRLRCPLSHGALADAVRAADGYTYSRAALHELRIARPRDVSVSPMTNKRMHSSKLSPNYRVVDEVRRLCARRPDAEE